MEEILVNMANIIGVRKKAAEYIVNHNSRILELGPLNRCLLDRKKFKNYYFADIRSTEEIKELYEGNEYLEKTGLSVDLQTIIDIDFVIKKSYKDTFKGVEKFDYIIVSHVLEHIPNLLYFFEDIQNILKSNGEIIILYPDRRFCFDSQRTDSSFSDVYDVYVNSGKNVARRVLDFFTNVVSENNPRKFWDTKYKVSSNKTDRDYKKNLKIYKEVSTGENQGDVHYWPFSDYAFIKFLFDANKYGFLPFGVKYFIPTQINTQEFLVILKYNDGNTDDEFYKYMQEAVDSYQKQHNKGLEVDNRLLEEIIEGKNEIISENTIIIKNLETNLKEVTLLLEQQRKVVSRMENSKSWRITKPIRILMTKFTLLKKQGIWSTIKRIFKKIQNN